VRLADLRFSQLVKENPMLLPALRGYVRSIAPGKMAEGKTVWVLGLTVYIGVLALAAVYAKFLVGDWFLFPLLVILLLMPLATLHPAIAGEREKRSLDLLLVAPVTSAQVVFAKTLRHWVTVGFCLLGFIGGFVVIEVARSLTPELTYERARPMLYVLSLGVLVCLATASVAGMATLFVSSRTRSTAAALVASLFVLLAWVVGIPILAAALGGPMFTTGFPALLHSNPFVQLAGVVSEGPETMAATAWRVLIYAIVCAAASVGLFVWAAFGVRDQPGSRRSRNA
jgi:ABC-type Na+ efflux pump permease subunit